MQVCNKKAITPVQHGLLKPAFLRFVISLFRFFFTHKEGPQAFTKQQVKLLKKRKIGDIICDNTNMTTINTNVFRIDSDQKSCEETVAIDVNDFIPRTLKEKLLQAAGMNKQKVLISK